MKKEIIRILLVSTILFPVGLISQVPYSIGFKDSLPLDPKITYGKLDNGFKYYIAKDIKSENEKVQMRFWVKAGQFNESTDQKQIAHAIEHAAFRESKNFPKGIWHEADKLSSIGMGPDGIGGSTGADHTRYSFNFPSQKSEILKVGLAWFRDIAGNLTFPSKISHHVIKEVQQEFMEKKAISTDLRSKYLPKLYKSIKDYSNPSEYMGRHTPETFRSFYRDWYRPNNMALLVVGPMDMDEEAIKSMIETNFADLKNPGREGKVIIDHNPEYLNDEDKFISLVEKELTENYIQIYFPLFSKPVKSMEDIKTSLIERIKLELIKVRVGSIAQQYLSPTTLVYTVRETFPPSFMTELRTNSNANIKPAIEAAISELKRIEQHGINEFELESIKQKLSREASSINGTGDMAIMDGLRQHFVTGAAFPGGKSDIIRQLLSSITLKEVEETFSQRINRNARMDVVLMMPKYDQSINRDTVFDWIDHAWDKKTDPIVAHNTLTELYEMVAMNAHVERDFYISENKEHGITELKLANGVNVVLKSVDDLVGHRSNKILMHGFSNGGASVYGAKKYFSALNAAHIIRHSGIGGFNFFELNDYLANKELKIVPYINHKEEGVDGYSHITDIEPMLQLTHLYFTRPNRDKAAFLDWLNKRQIILQKSGYDADAVLQDTIAGVFEDRDSGNIKSEILGLSETDFQTAYSIYQERFSNAGDFTFVIVGNFQMDKVISLVNKYLGSLPDDGRREFRLVQNKLIQPKPGNYEIVTKMEGAKVELCFVNNLPYDIYREVDLLVLNKILTSIIFKRLRVQESAVYFAGSFFKQYHFPDWNKLNISFKCKHEDVERLIQATWEEITQLKGEGPDEMEFENAVKSLKNSLDNPRSNRKLLNKLVSHYRGEKRLEDWTKQKHYLDHLTRNDIQNVVLKLLRKNLTFQFKVLPAKNLTD